MIKRLALLTFKTYGMDPGRQEERRRLRYGGSPLGKTTTGEKKVRVLAETPSNQNAEQRENRCGLEIEWNLSYFLGRGKRA